MALIEQVKSNREAIRKILTGKDKVCSINMDAGQNIPINVLTPVNFDNTNTSSTRPEWADLVNDRITPTIPGFYMFIAWAYWANNNTGFRYAAQTGVVAATLIPFTFRKQAYGSSEQSSPAAYLMNGTTDYMGMSVFQNAVNPLQLTYAKLLCVKLF